MTTIRPLRRDDFDDWFRLFTGYLDYYETRLSDEIIHIAFERLLDPQSKTNGRLAIRDNHAVGLVHFLYHDHMWRPEGVCYLQDLYTETPARGTGVGKALIDAVYTQADADGVPTVYWLTQDFNETARRLYDQIAVKTPFIKYQRP